jgi:hypothetical protein
MCEDIAPHFGDKRMGCCIMTMHHLTLLFPPGNFLPKTINMIAIPHPLYFSVSLIEDKTERPPF